MPLLEAAVKALRVGDPLDDATEMGPLISAEQRASVGSYVAGDVPVAFRGERARRRRASGSRRPSCARSPTTTAPRARRSSVRSRP